MLYRIYNNAKIIKKKKRIFDYEFFQYTMYVNYMNDIKYAK